MPIVWDLLDQQEQDFLRGFMPKGWKPSLVIVESLNIEPLEEIEKLMKRVPVGDAALIGKRS